MRALPRQMFAVQNAPKKDPKPINYDRVGILKVTRQQKRHLARINAKLDERAYGNV